MGMERFDRKCPNRDKITVERIVTASTGLLMVDTVPTDLTVLGGGRIGDKLSIESFSAHTSKNVSFGHGVFLAYGNVPVNLDFSIRPTRSPCDSGLTILQTYRR